MEGVIISPVNIDERKALNISAGDTVRVWQKIEEKGKTRLQAFEGLVLATKHGSEAGGTFTVRKVSNGIGVEKIFPIHSPMIDKIEIVRRVKVRRSKLYFIREKVAREMRRQLRRMNLVSESTQSETEVEAARVAAVEAEAKAAEEAAAAAEEAKKAEEAAAAAKAEAPAAEETTSNVTEGDEEAKAE